jgi:hypothetical protein
MNLFSQPSDHLNGREWIEWRKKVLMREAEAIPQKIQQYIGQGGEVKLGRVSLFLCLDVKWNPNTSFYMTKGWLFGWVTGYRMWISWELPIAHEFQRIPCNFLFFATFAGIHGF